jgi:hypothetical protein
MLLNELTIRAKMVQLQDQQQRIRSPEEQLARIEAVLKRSSVSSSSIDVLDDFEVKNSSQFGVNGLRAGEIHTADSWHLGTNETEDPDNSIRARRTAGYLVGMTCGTLQPVTRTYLRTTQASWL